MFFQETQAGLTHRRISWGCCPRAWNSVMLGNLVYNFSKLKIKTLVT